MAIKLPQHEEGALSSEKRKACLRLMQAAYQYTYAYAETIAVARKVPWRELPGLTWLWRFAMNLLRLIPSLPGLLLKVMRYLLGRPMRRLRDYIFYPRSPQPNANLVNTFHHDLIFGQQRVVGVNPVALRAVSERQPLPLCFSVQEVSRIFDEQAAGEIGFADALKQKRLYVLDYSMLAVLQKNPGTIDGGRKQYVSTPIVLLFQQTDGQLRPIAIKLFHNTTADNPTDPIYTPKDGNHWLLAKTFAQIADGNHHILHTHATRIHYVMEAIILASRRQLYKCHPLYVLLKPHLQFTLVVNHQHTFLKNWLGRPGRFGELFAGDYEATLQCMADGMTSFDFRESAFPNDIARREVDSPGLFYPFRDDGLLLWGAIQRFVAEYVDLYYRSDQDVVEDIEIQTWAREIGAKDYGRIPGFPTTLASRAALAETIGHVIFLCTAYHSCIHFKQYEYAGLVPNMPYAAYAPAPKDRSIAISADDLFKYLPGFRAAYSQTWTFYLTNFRANQLGQYKMRDFAPEARGTIVRFQQNLQAIEATIIKRNETRAVKYERLLPSLIPNSVTV